MGRSADNFGNDPDSLTNITNSLSLTLNFEKSKPIRFDHIATFVLPLPISILQIEVTVCGGNYLHGKSLLSLSAFSLDF